MKTYKVQIKSGKFINKDYFLDHVSSLEDGQYNIFVEKSEIGQSKYFFYRDVIADYLGFGTSKEKKELHEYLKHELLTEIFKEPDNLNVNDYSELTYSTKFLSPAGWLRFNRSLELFALTKWDIKLI